MLSSRSRSTFLALILLALPGMAAAQAGPMWSFKGFGTLGAIGTDTNAFGLRRDATQDTGATRDWTATLDSRLGLQLDVDFNNPFHATVQWIARDRVGDFFEQNLEWAFLRWRLRDDLDLRLGRMATDSFMLSEYRNVGYAYPWMRPPHEFYALVIPYHFDGTDLTWRTGLGEGFLTVKGYGGYNFTQARAADAEARVIDLEMLIFGGNLGYEVGDWRFKLSYAWLNTIRDLPQFDSLYAALRDPIVNNLWPGASDLVDPVSINHKSMHYSSLGLAYDDGLWQIQAEAAYIDSEVSQLPTMGNSYLSVGRRFEHVTLYTLLGIAKSLKDATPLPPVTLPIAELEALRDDVDTLINWPSIDEKSVSLGVRWDVYQNIALKAQWSHLWLGAHGVQFMTDPDRPIPDTVNMWSFGVDFVF